jgi:hypothetical protein
MPKFEIDVTFTVESNDLDDAWEMIEVGSEATGYEYMMHSGGEV